MAAAFLGLYGAGSDSSLESGLLRTPRDCFCFGVGAAFNVGAASFVGAGLSRPYVTFTAFGGAVFVLAGAVLAGVLEGGGE